VWLSRRIDDLGMTASMVSLIVLFAEIIRRLQADKEKPAKPVALV
jgi:hypothetical protein